MSRTILLFNKDFLLFAEWRFGDHGVLNVYANKNAAHWAEEMSLWKKTGIPYNCPKMDMLSNGSLSRGMGVCYAKFDSPMASSALIDWTLGQGMNVLVYPKERMKYWEDINKLPLGPKDRYKIGRAIEMADHDKMSLFDDAIEKANKLVKDDKAQKNMNKQVVGSVTKSV